MDTLTAYLAGLFDGEGCITIGLSKHGDRVSHSLRVQVRMAHKPSVEKFFITYGGHLYTNEGKYGNHTQYTWTLNGKLSCQFLADIQPYSIAKQEVISLARQFLETTKTDFNLRQHIREDIQKLNQID
jgi:hypothetical protein